MYKQGITAGALFAALAVILGAFGAHALKAVMAADQLAVFETGVKYQFYHAFALIACGIIYGSFPAKQIKTSVTLFITGIVLFSGSLYAMTLLSTQGMSIGPVGIITPIGGLCFIIGWILLFLGVVKKQ